MPSTDLLEAMGKYNEELAEAVEWVKRCPNPMPDPSEIEIRPIFEYEDFAEAMPPNRSSKKSKCARSWRGGRLRTPRRYNDYQR